MVGALARRGPDGEGIECWGQAVLGHRRLAIFDLSEAGKQPMLAPDRSVGVVFNGAIYNHRELRKRLEGCGYLFRSNTDTEVLVHGYREWGVDGLVTKLRGMFAFGLWDNTLRKLYLVRDRLGVKPLVFVVRGGKIAFASTVRALRYTGLLSDFDENAVGEYLQFGFVPDDYSIYQGARKVPPASVIEWNNGNIEIRRYWSSPTVTSSSLSFRESVEQAEQQLLGAVKVRLDADVPIGILLSGGIDSALICWAAKKLGHKITAYTIGVPGDPWDETAAARTTARALGLDHCVLEMRPEEQFDIEDLIKAYAEPFACASALGMLMVSKRVASSAKVLLTGDGGDDVFLGYPRHRHVWMAEKLSRITPPSVRNWWRTGGSVHTRVGPFRRMAPCLDYVAGSPRVFGDYVNGLEIRGERLMNTIDNRSISFPTAGCSLVEHFLKHEYKNRLVGEYLTKVDGATMHYGLEARSPFLDQDLWEFASSLPFERRLHHWRLKAILREVARRRFGAHLAEGKKRGFGIPVHRWIIGPWRPLVEACLQESILEKEGWIRSRSASKMFESSLAKGEAPLQLWYLLVLELWMRFERSQAKSKNLALI
jgi:asparagine synthase (glutamine-hydrolysing)